jgi:WD40 repeat protein
VWNAWSGRLLLTHIGEYGYANFSRDGKTLGFLRDGQEVRLVEVATGLEYRTFVSSLGAGEGEYRNMNLSPDGQLLAVGMDDGVRLWELASGRELGHLPQGQSGAVLFRPDGSELVTCGAGSVRRWPIHRDAASGGRLRIGPPQNILLPGCLPHTATQSADGHQLAVACEANSFATLLDLDDVGRRPPPFPHPSLNCAILSPDSRWMVTAGWHTSDIKVWDTQIGKVVKELPPARGTGNVFSPDGKFLVNCRGDEFCFYDVATWEPVRYLRRPQISYAGAVAFTADSQVAALELAPGIIHLVDMPSGRALARLEDPHHDRAAHLRFSPDGTYFITMSGFSRLLHVWDLRAIRQQLRGMGLDWEAAPLPATRERPDPRPLAVEVEAGPPWYMLPAPVVSFTPAARRHRAATPEQLAGWIKQLEDPRTAQAAAQALEEVGPPAVAALARMAGDPQAKPARRAREIIDHIAVAEALVPARVGLKLQNARVGDAVQALAKQAKVRLVYHPGRQRLGAPAPTITLDLEGVPFWEALDRLCESGSLAQSWTYTRDGAVLQLTEGQPAGQGTIAYAGPLRLQATAVTHHRTLGLQDSHLPSEGLSVNLSLIAEPENAIGSVSHPRVVQAKDEADRSLARNSITYGGYYGEAPAQMPFSFSVDLQAPAKPGGRLKELKGVLPVELLVGRRDLVTIAEPSRAKGKTFQGAAGIRIQVQNVQQLVGQFVAGVTITGPADWAYDPRLHGFELVEKDGRRHRIPYRELNRQRRGQLRPDDLAWLGIAPQAIFPTYAPWSALATAGPNGSTEWKGELRMWNLGMSVVLAKLVFFSSERQRTELPFEFHDLPLP